MRLVGTGFRHRKVKCLGMACMASASLLILGFLGCIIVATEHAPRIAASLANMYGGVGLIQALMPLSIAQRVGVPVALCWLGVEQLALALRALQRAA